MRACGASSNGIEIIQNGGRKRKRKLNSDICLEAGSGYLVAGLIPFASLRCRPVLSRLDFGSSSRVWSIVSRLGRKGQLGNGITGPDPGYFDKHSPFVCFVLNDRDRMAEFCFPSTCLGVDLNGIGRQNRYRRRTKKERL